MSTSVLCFKRQSLPSFTDLKPSYTPFSRNFTLDSFSVLEPWFVPRSYAETCSEFLQVIPYIHLFVEEKILSYSRGGKGSENRLHDKRSIGFGGHIELHDGATDDLGKFIFQRTINNCISRELVEELGENQFDVNKAEFKGVLIDPTTEVGKVHLGISVNLKIDHLKIVEEERVIEKCEFSNLNDLRNLRKSYETWSRLIIDEQFQPPSVAELEYTQAIH